MPAPVSIGRTHRSGEAALFGVAALLSLAAGMILSGQLEGLSGNRLLVVPAVLGLFLLIGWLAVTRGLAVLVLGFALLGIVRVEPAPVDAVFALLIGVSCVVSRPRPRVPLFVGLPLAAFALLTLLSLLNTTDTARAMKFELTTLYMIVLAVWLSWVFTEARWVRAAMKTYLVVAFVSGAAAAAAVFLPVPGHDWLTFGGDRAQGLFKDPNVFSAFMVPAAAILLEELTTPRLTGWRRPVLAILFGIVTLAVAVAYSRAAWLNYAVAITTLVVVQAIRRGGVRRALRTVAVIAASGAVGFTFLSATGSLSFLEERSHLQRYDQQRFSNQGSAFDSMTIHLFGYGPGQVEDRLAISTHSTFARVAFEQGLFGLAALIAVLGGTLICALVLVRGAPDVNGVGTAALLGTWLGQIANSFFIDSLHWRHLWIVAALIWCGYMTVSASQASRELRSAPERKANWDDFSSADRLG